MHFLADMGVSQRVVEWLRISGHDAVHLRDEGLQRLPNFPVPLDVVVTSPDDFAWRKDVVGTIEWPASREGKVLYAVACW